MYVLPHPEKKKSHQKKWKRGKCEGMRLVSACCMRSEELKDEGNFIFLRKCASACQMCEALCWIWWSGRKRSNLAAQKEACEHRQAGQVSSVSFIRALDGLGWMLFAHPPFVFANYQDLAPKIWEYFMTYIPIPLRKMCLAWLLLLNGHLCLSLCFFLYFLCVCVGASNRQNCIKNSKVVFSL